MLRIINIIFFMFLSLGSFAAAMLYFFSKEPSRFVIMYVILGLAIGYVAYRVFADNKNFALFGQQRKNFGLQRKETNKMVVIIMGIMSILLIISPYFITMLFSESRVNVFGPTLFIFTIYKYSALMTIPIIFILHKYIKAHDIKIKKRYEGYLQLATFLLMLLTFLFFVLNWFHS